MEVFENWINECEGDTGKEKDTPPDEAQGLEFKDAEKTTDLYNNLEGRDSVDQKWSLWRLIGNAKKVFTVTKDIEYERDKVKMDGVEEDSLSDQTQGSGSKDADSEGSDYQESSLHGFIGSSKRDFSGVLEVDEDLLMDDRQLELLKMKLVKSSDERCPKNLLDMEPYPSVKTLATFAELIYTNKNPEESDAVYGGKILSDKLSSLRKLGWKLLITANNAKLSNCYFGAAFYHSGLQQVVVAHRGTAPLCSGAWYTNVIGIFGTNYTPCMNSSINFVDFIRQVINSVNTQHSRHYTLTITGHSLGAWLAQVTTFSVKYLVVKRIGSKISLDRNPEVGIHAKTVGFDSPGARDMLDRLLGDHYNRYGMNVPRLDGLNINLYLSAPNHINTCGVHLGRIYRVNFDVSNFTWFDKTITYTLKSHAITNFVDAFKNDTYAIGEVLDWAKSIREYKKLFKMLNWDNNYHGHAIVNNPDNLKKFLRYRVAKDISIFKSSFGVFSEVELQMIFRVHELQEQRSELTSLNEFIKSNNFKLKSTELLPDFYLDFYNRTIAPKNNSEESLAELCRRFKQLMRWPKKDFMKAVEEQINKDLKQPADFMYYVEGQSHLDSLPKCCLDFVDSVGFLDLMVSGGGQVLCLVTNNGDGAFQMTRLRNILHQIEKTAKYSDRIIKYFNKKLYTFVKWSQLRKLTKVYGWPFEKEYLMVVDCTSSSATIKDEVLYTELLNRIRSNSMKVVMIVSEPMDISNSSTIFINTVNFVSNVNFSDLTPDSQKTMLNRSDTITIGDKEYSFESFLGEDYSVSKIDQILCSEYLKNSATIENYAINIEDTRPTLGDIQMPFFKVNIKTSMKFFVNCVKSPNNLVVMSGLSHKDLETGAAWEQLKELDIILAEEEAELTFRDTCDKNQDKCIYLFGVLGEDIFCKEIFNQQLYLLRKFFHLASIDMQKFARTKLADDMFVICSDEDKSSFLGLIEDLTKREALRDNVLTAATKEMEANIIQKYFDKSIHFLKIVKRCVSFSNEPESFVFSYGDEGDADDENCETDESYELKWRYSHGSMENLFPCMATESCEPMNETALSKTERNLVVIIDEPGMGKTTSLARLSRLIQSPWVIYVELKYFQVQIDELPEELTVQSVARFLLSGCRYQTLLLEYLLQSKSNSKRVVLMFDGFDEIDDYIENKESSKDKLIKLFVFLQGSPAVQTFITARNYLKESLEQQLRQTATCFERINAKEQQNYLYIFWRSCLSLELEVYGKREGEQLNNYVGEVLRQAELVLGSDMDCFMGVPLQLRMLAEVFRPQSDRLVQSWEVLSKQINIVSAPNLYKKFIDLKYDIYLRGKTSKGKDLDEKEKNKYLEYVTKTHGKLSVRTFFPDFYDKNFDAFDEEWLNKLNRHGLVQKKGNGGFQFVHRTYAEYFCAQMVVYWLNQPKSFSRSPLFKKILLPQILLHPASKIIRLFMNEQFNEIQMSNVAPKLNAKCISKLWVKDSAIFRNRNLRTALHIAVLEKNENIITFLLSGLNEESTQKSVVSLITQHDLFNNTALNMMDAPKLRDNALVLDGILTNILQRIVETCSDETRIKIFFACLFNRNDSNPDETREMFFFGRLFNKYNIFAANVTEEELILRNSFYQVITNYLDCTSKIFDRVKAVELLILPFRDAIENNNVELVKNILFEQLQNNTERYCILLTKYKENRSQTALHLAAECGHLDMVQFLAEQTDVTTVVPFAVLMAQRDTWKRTPLHRAALQGREIIIEYLVKRGADINAISGEGMSSLMYAAMSGKLETVKHLVEHGAVINITDNDGTTALYGAAHWGQFPIVEYLLQQKADPDRVGREGGTALTVATRGKKWDVVRLLLKSGADVNADGGKALRRAIKLEEWAIVEALIDKGATVVESEVKANLSKFKERYPKYEFKKQY